MNKETLIEIFKKNKDTNFSIITNIAEGRGINGVNFVKYYGEANRKPEYANNYTIDETTRIKGFMDTCIVIEHYKNNNYWAGGIHTLYIPYDAIVGIDFVTEHRPSYPLKISHKHTLKVLS